MDRIEEIQKLVCPQRDLVFRDCTKCEYFNSVTVNPCNNPLAAQINDLFQKEIAEIFKKIDKTFPEEVPAQDTRSKAE